MPVPWWAKVSPDYYKRPNTFAASAAPRVRRMRTVLADTRLRDQPATAAAFMNANVPISLVQRADMELRKVQAASASNIKTQTGIAGTVTGQEKETPKPGAPKPPEQIALNDVEEVDDDGYSWGEFFGDAADGIGTVAGAIGDFGKGLATGALEGVNALFSPLTVPVAVGRANENPEDYAQIEADRQAMLATQQERDDLGPFEFMADLTDAGLTIGSAARNLTKGFNRFVGLEELTPGQQQDMRSQGYDPNSFTSRYSWYYSSMEAGQRAIADSDVAALAQEFDPDKVTAMREIFVSDVLNDPEAFTGLTPEAQALYTSATADDGDKQDKELFERMRHSTTLNLGSTVSDMLGMKRGSTEAFWTSIAADLTMYWYADPLAGAVKGARALREANWGVPASSLAARENAILALKVPGDVTSEAATPVGRAINEQIATIERFIKIDDAAQQARAVNDMGKVAALDKQASQMFQQYAIRHPDMVPMFDIVTRLRHGQLDSVLLKSDAEMAKAMQKAADNGEEFSSLTYVAPKVPNKPAWTLVEDAANPGKFTNESLNNARAEIVNRMSQYIFKMSLAEGRPLHRGVALMPGQVAFNRRIRAALVPMRDALVGANGSVVKVMNEADKAHIIKFGTGSTSTADLLLSNVSGEVVKLNYTGKWAPTFEKMASRLSGNSYTGHKITFTGADSLETYRRFVVSMFPKHMANAMTLKWARSGPGERMAQWRQTVEVFVEAANFKKDAISREITDRLTKGVVPTTSANQRAGANEIYSAVASDNLIKADGHNIAAALWPYQLSDGVTLPNFAGIRHLQERTGVLSALTGLFHYRMVHDITAAWKVGKVGNPANMLRQAGELGVMSVGEQGIRHLLANMHARRMVLAETLTQRTTNKDLARGANSVLDRSNHARQQRLNEYFTKQDWVAYRAELAQQARNAGATANEARVLSQLADGVKYEHLVKDGGLDRAWLFMSAPLDALRRTRTAYLQTVWGSRKSAAPDSAWAQYLDAEFLDSQTRAALGEFGANANDYALILGNNAAQDLAGAADRAISGVVARVPNQRQLVGTLGDAGVRQWFRELDSRLTDSIGAEVARAYALEKLGPANRGSSVPVVDTLNIMRQVANKPLIPAGVNTAEEIAAWLIKHSDEGAVFREKAMRLMYANSGTRAIDDVMRDEAINSTAAAMIRDIEMHMGMHGRQDVPNELLPLFDEVGRGKGTRLDTMKAVPPDFRPKEVSGWLYVPTAARGGPKGIVNLASKMYNFTVARPLQRLAITPEYIANRNVAYRALEPAADEFIKRGFTPTQAAGFLEEAASKYAVRTTFRYTDEALEHSFFSELVDNFLMFQRAAEDFLKRASRVGSANPAILSRGFLLMEAGQHSGMIYPQTETDEEGNAETHLVFTFPASGLFAKAFNEVGQALGMGDNAQILNPLFSSMSSQVRYMNPSLVNPIGFSTTPLIGMPLRTVRFFYPETDTKITDLLATLEGGGERFFAEQSVLQSIMPTPIARLIPALPAVGQDFEMGTLASAVRNAVIHFGAAGLMPGPDATDDEKEQASEAIQEQATNQVIWRAVIGAFSPWAPRYGDPDTAGKLPEVNPIDAARGINSLRGEWFDILQQMTEKHGSIDAFTHATTEWLRRHPQGKSILNPEAFTVGSTQAPGTANESGSFNSGPLVTDWLIENRKWLEDNRAVGYYLLPSFHEPNFSSSGMRLQVRTGLREYKNTEEFYRDVRQAIGEREFWQIMRQRDQELAVSRNPKGVQARYAELINDWKAAHPATAARQQEKQDPYYVHATLAPALKRMLEAGEVPQGVDLTEAQSVWDHYSAYREKYNEIVRSKSAQFQKAALNADYRNEGDLKFRGTRVEDLWEAMNVYEVN